MKEMHEKILAAIKEHYLEKGYGPTVREIGEMVGLKSTSSVQTYLEKMEHLGLIERGGFSSPRAIKIPGFNYEKEVVDNRNGDFECEKSENETQIVHFGTVFVLHGYWVTGGDSGVNIFGVSADLKYLSEKMKEEARKLLEEIRRRGVVFKIDNIEHSETKYEIEGVYGDEIKFYITEHEVKTGKEEARKDDV